MCMFVFRYFSGNTVGSKESNTSQRVVSEQFKQCLVEINVPVVEAKLGFFQMQLELVLSHIMELCQSILSIAPERLDAVDMPRAFDEFVVAVIDPKALF